MTIVSTQNALSFEAYSVLPGSRALGMAGIFHAQADDTTAIWYNPAGLSRQNLGINEVSVDWGKMPKADGIGDFSSDSGNFRFIGLHIANLPNFKGLFKRPAIGFALLKPYKLQIDIPEQRSPLDTKTFGRVDIGYYQASIQASTGIGENISVGATFDTVWTSVECLQHTPCTNDGPSGVGFSMALNYSWPVSDTLNISAAGIYRTKASLGYDTISTTGIGRYTESYAPDRPESYTFATNVQISQAWGLSNINISIEDISWSDTLSRNIEFDASGMDYQRIGIGGETLIPIVGNIALAIRAGYAISTSDHSLAFPDVETIALGTGVSFQSRHFVDLALESRDTTETTLDPDGGSLNLYSISYSFQF